MGMQNRAEAPRGHVVGGARTPFVKAFTDFVELDTIALGVAAVRGVLERTKLPYREVEGIVWGEGHPAERVPERGAMRSRSRPPARPRVRGG